MASGWRRVREVFEDAVELPEGERRDFVERRCGPDDELRREVCSLLDADARVLPEFEGTALDLHLACEQQREQTSLVGEVLDGFTLEGILGEGGTSTVYLGSRTVAGVRQRGAVKVLRAALVGSGVSRRFRQEQRALANLDHPGIVRVLGAGSLPDRRPYLITEYVEGQALDVHVAAHDLGRRDRLHLFLEVCEAVQHAHGLLTVHRDLKPSNILVDATGRPRILDFGIAKLLDAGVDPRFTDLFGRGPLTLECASPEQVRGAPVHTGSDVYSLGVLLYRLVCGGSPYGCDGKDRAELERWVLDEPPVAPGVRAAETGAPDVPRDLATVILCALRKEPAERYPTVLHLAEDLRRFLTHRPIRARRTSPGAALLKRMRRHPLWTAAVLALLFAGLGTWLGTRRSLTQLAASEGVAWRAHRDAVYALEVLSNVLLEASANDVLQRGQVEELVADAERRMDEKLGDAPEAEGRLRLALARIHLELGNSRRARDHAARGVELARDTVGLGRMDLERGLGVLAEILILDGDRRAVELCRERLALIEEIQGLESPRADLARGQLQRAQALPEGRRPPSVDG